MQILEKLDYYELEGVIAHEMSHIKNYDIKNVPFISEKSKNEWEGHIPHLWYSPLVWEESSIKALRALRQECFISEINHDLVMAKFQTSYRRLVDNIDEICKKYSISYSKVKILRIKILFKRIIVGILNRCLMWGSMGKRSFIHCFFYDVYNIRDAEKKLFAIVENSINFKE